MPVGAIGAGFNNTPQITNIKEAAGAMESMLFKELMKSMTESVGKSELFGSSFQSEMYQDMYASVLAEQAGGHLGIADMLQQALGGVSGSNNAGDVASPGLRGIGAAGAMETYRAVAQKTGAPPSNAALYQTAMSFVDDVSASRWSKDGALTPMDLGADIATREADGIAAFNVNDANGYEGFPKCNLFAFEMLRRGGYTVPITARSHGWGFMGADTTTQMAEKGKVGSWASVITDMSKDQMDGKAYAGVPLLLAGSGAGDKVGHMAVADRIHRVQRNGDGDIVALEYSGWEATGNGASYGRRMWRVEGVAGNGRGGLARIEVLEPKKASAAEQGYVTVGSHRPGASITDKPDSSRGFSQGFNVSTDINQ
ncbi:MAG: rod-binding protein [Deltaproteobacteria bacterium]|nr:rod-binding protein [Deltaproteobacteria bacterium]